MKSLNDFLNEEKDTSKAHSVKEGEGADDKKYLDLMHQYKQARKSDQTEARKLFREIERLREKGDVSKQAKLAGAYL